MRYRLTGVMAASAFPAQAGAFGDDPRHRRVPGLVAQGAQARAAPFQRLVYPMHDAATLGVHLTLDLAGRGRFGPDIEWIDRIDYTVDPGRRPLFEAAIRRYWPDLPEDALEPAYAGIRPKLQGPGEPARDFCIHGPGEHGVPGFVALYGIESPGLTASLAIGEMAVRLIEGAER